MGLLFEVEDHVAVMTLDRPDALNAIDTDLRGQLAAAWERIDADDTIRVVILTGAGRRAFCVGSDLKDQTPAGSMLGRTFGTRGPEHLLDGLVTDKPIICAVNGFAIGGGLELAMACDIRIAVTTAEFALSEARVGSIPGACGTINLPRLVGPSLAMHMMLTGDRISAATALERGLVSELVGPDDLMARAHDLARRIAENAPLSVRAIKRLVRHGMNAPDAVARDLERFTFGLIRDTADRQEGRLAFREKRPPVYRGA